MKKVNFTQDDVKHTARLANLQLTNEQTQKLLTSLQSIISYMSKIQNIDTKGVTETSQVTGLENVFREDIVDEKRLLTQKEALSNAKQSHKGFFVVPAIFD